MKYDKEAKINNNSLRLKSEIFKDLLHQLAQYVAKYAQHTTKQAAYFDYIYKMMILIVDKT